jgi:polo-like kinase 4
MQPLSVGTTRPVPFTVFLLSPHTHKAVHGHVTVLQSRSVLIDFREGERRRGKNGDEVLLVDTLGTEVSFIFDKLAWKPISCQVKVYSAPHLSTPCCLVEAVAVYPTAELPPEYWKQYNDAACLIEKIKQRTPKVCLFMFPHRSTLKCLIACIVFCKSKMHAHG